METNNTKDVAVKQTRITRDWTQGNITNNLLSLSWPLMVSYFLNNIGPLIDTIWIGKLGSASVAGVGIAGTIVLLISGTLSGLTMGMRVFIGRSIGAGDKDAALHYVQQYFSVSLILAIVISILGIFLAEPIFTIFGVDVAVVQQGSTYLHIQFLGMITMTLITFSDATMQASGDTVLPMFIAISYRLLHIILCPLLVFGVGIFPQLGVSGAALSNIITQGIGGLVGIYLLYKGYSRLKLDFKNWRFDPKAIWRMIRIGLPNSFMNIQQMLHMLVLLAFLAPFGTSAVAAHTIFMRIDQVLLILTLSLGMSAGVLGAQNIGAKKIDRASKTGWNASGFAVIIMVLASSVIFIWAEQITRIFGNNDPDLIKMSSMFLRIACASYVFLGISTVLRAFLSAVGDTMVSFIFELVPTWGILIPLVWASTKFTDFGVLGIRWILGIRILVGFIAFLVYFWIGKWKQRKI
jgi:putative MATE family efflux protein